MAKGVAGGAGFSFGGHRSGGELSVSLISYELRLALVYSRVHSTCPGKAVYECSAEK